MKTQVLPVTQESLALAGELIRRGELVGMPTETVYGLAADAGNPLAVRRIFEAKGRPSDNPIIVHVSSIEEIPPLVTEIPENARKLMEAYWPGPMTLILPHSARIPREVSAGLNTVGIRMPSSWAAREIIRYARCPIAAPSANSSGRPSPTTAAHVLEDMDGKIPLILDDGPCQVGVESSVIDACGEVPLVLRPGAITPEMIRAVLGDVQVDEHVMQPLQEGETVRSPGMKYRHYAPSARTTIVEGPPEAVIREICTRYDQAEAEGLHPAILGFVEHDFGGRSTLSLGHARHPEEAASLLFARLRELDELGLDRAFCEASTVSGIGLAVMNRMGRAAGFDMILAGTGKSLDGRM